MSNMKTVLVDLMILKNAIDRVRELHTKSEFGTCEFCIAGYTGGYPYNYKFPCPTLRALDGDSSDNTD